MCFCVRMSMKTGRDRPRDSMKIKPPSVDYNHIRS